MKNTIRPEEITSALQQAFSDFATDSNLEQIGTVLQVGDGVVSIYGLTQVQAGELVVFENSVKALVLNLEEDTVGAVILGEDRTIKEGDIVRRTGKINSLQVGQGMLGRVIDSLGNPIDGKGPIQGETFEMPIERNAPGVIYREPVNQPLQTGIKAIDAMIPIGRGQRELIIGDRRTGKTTIALDTIINQRILFEQSKPVFCIYVAIGQKASTIAHVKTILEEHKAMEYTTIVASPASTPAPLQFLAPFSGTAIAEFFEFTGQDALIVYDDLSKQAKAYRQVCLLLRRPPGREAYPGDIFYLHARLLERASKINTTDAIAQQTNDLPPSLKGKIKGGGSLTALPIIETQAGDVSAYIPTNVISITDGQIFLEKNLFNAGIRPAINVGISVSRVGSSAQINSMKKIASKLKLDQAQFLELEAFAKFGADLDSATQLTINRGRKNQEILKQTLHQPMPIAHQIATIYASTRGYLDRVPLNKVREFEKAYVALLMKKYAGILENITKGILSKHEEKVLTHVANELTHAYCPQSPSK